MKIMTSISAGELFDKIAILSLKVQRVCDADKLKKIGAELEYLTNVRNELFPSNLQPPDLRRSIAELAVINQSLWDVEDLIRQHEQRGDFGDRFVQLARSVYQLNDERCKIKRQIDWLVGSEITEEKFYTSEGA